MGLLFGIGHGDERQGPQQNKHGACFKYLAPIVNGFRIRLDDQANNVGHSKSTDGAGGVEYGEHCTGQGTAVVGHQWQISARRESIADHCQSHQTYCRSLKFTCQRYEQESCDHDQSRHGFKGLANETLDVGHSVASVQSSELGEQNVGKHATGKQCDHVAEHDQTEDKSRLVNSQMNNVLQVSRSLLSDKIEHDAVAHLHYHDTIECARRENVGPVRLDVDWGRVDIVVAAIVQNECELLLAYHRMVPRVGTHQENPGCCPYQCENP